MDKSQAVVYYYYYARFSIVVKSLYVCILNRLVRKEIHDQLFMLVNVIAVFNVF